MTHAYVIDLGNIIKCDVAKETTKTIVLMHRNWGNWERTYRIQDGKVFNTWREAHAALLAAAEQEVAAARLHLERLNGRIGRIKGMKPPAEEGQ